MKDFVFSIQSVSDMTENNVKQQRIILKNIEAALMKVTSDIDANIAETTRIQDEFSAAVKRGITATDAMNYKRYSTQLKNIRIKLEEKRESIEAERVACLKDLIEIRKDKKVLDKLEQKEHDAYKKQVKKENSRVTDDIFMHKVSVS